ncbi:MAG: Jag N-terminal domain-containing protein [Defluviitaleaceae bacterium]|nr:Jag N-terminal domain-containing protein [Defluviitaleaceae bacterium]
MGKIIEVEKEAETVELATEIAIKDLGFPKEFVAVEVLTLPVKGLFGFGKKKAKIKATVTFDSGKEVLKFLEQFFEVSKLNLNAKISRNNSKGVKINIYGEDASVLIGKQGRVLDSLERISTLVANKYKISKRTVKLDIEGYRDKRRDQLIEQSASWAAQVKKTGKPHILHPMSTRERRVIHNALEKNPDVYTKSQGEEPKRYVTIYKTDEK